MTQGLPYAWTVRRQHAGKQTLLAWDLLRAVVHRVIGDADGLLRWHRETVAHDPLPPLSAPNADTLRGISHPTALRFLKSLGVTNPADLAATSVALMWLPRRGTDAYLDDMCLMITAGMQPPEILDRLADPDTIPDRDTLLTLTGLRGIRLTDLPSADVTPRGR